MTPHRRTPSGGSNSSGSSQVSRPSSTNVDGALLYSTTDVAIMSGPVRQVDPCCDIEEAAARFDAFRRKLLPAAGALREMYESAVMLNESRLKTARLFQSFLVDSPLAKVTGESPMVTPDDSLMNDAISLEGEAPPSERTHAAHTMTAAASICSEATTVQVDNRTAAGGWRSGNARRTGSRLPGSVPGRERRKEEDWRVVVAMEQQNVDAILEEECGEETKRAEVGQGQKELNGHQIMGGHDLPTHQKNNKTGSWVSRAIDRVAKSHSDAADNAVNEIDGQFKEQGNAAFKVAAKRDLDEETSQLKLKRTSAKNVLSRDARTDTGGSFVAVHEEAFHATCEQIDGCLLSAVRYIEEWDKVVNTRVQGRVMECRRLKANLQRYDKKVNTLRAKAFGVETRSNSQRHKPKLNQRLDRNELKLIGAREAYDTYSEGLFLLVEEITERGWMDIYPVLLKILQFDVRCNSDCAEVFSQLNGAIGILHDIGRRHELSATGRLKALKKCRPAELFTGQKLISHRVCVVHE